MSVIDRARGPKLQTYNPGNIANNIGAWTLSGDTGNTLAVATGGPGLFLATDGTDNDCASACAAGEVVPLLTTASNFGYEAVFQLTEGNTDDSNWFIGFSDVVDNSFFGDTGALASMDAIGLYKVENSLFFRTCALNAAAQSGETTTTAFASATEYRIRVDCRVFASGTTIRYFVNETELTSDVDFTATDHTAMRPVISVANGGANAETLWIKSFVPYANALAA